MSRPRIELRSPGPDLNRYDYHNIYTSVLQLIQVCFNRFIISIQDLRYNKHNEDNLPMFGLFSSFNGISIFLG